MYNPRFILTAETDETPLEQLFRFYCVGLTFLHRAMSGKCTWYASCLARRLNIGRRLPRRSSALIARSRPWKLWGRSDVFKAVSLFSIRNNFPWNVYIRDTPNLSLLKCLLFENRFPLQSGRTTYPVRQASIAVSLLGYLFRFRNHSSSDHGGSRNQPSFLTLSYLTKAYYPSYTILSYQTLSNLTCRILT